MKRTLIYIVVILIVSACGSKKNSGEYGSAGEKQITIRGTIENGADQLVTLELMEPSEFVPLDSSRCDRKGFFRFDIKGEGPNFYSLKYTEEGYITIIAGPGDVIEVKGNPDNIYPYSVTGSEASRLVGELALEHRKVLDELREISEKSAMLMGDPDYVIKKQELNASFDSLTSVFHEYSKNFIHDHPSSLSILIALYNQFGPGLPVFHPLTDFDVYRFADSALYANYPENHAVMALHSQLMTALQQIEHQKASTGPEPGDIAPDFVMESDKGDLKALSELRGKYVLLQVWASWSKPSVEENRFLENCIRQFNPESFAIFQVSIDSDREDWLKAINGKYENWIQVSDLQRWESAVVNLYSIERIPANFLIDPRGKIIAMDLFGDDLKKELMKYIQ